MSTRIQHIPQELRRFKDRIRIQVAAETAVDAMVDAFAVAPIITTDVLGALSTSLTYLESFLLLMLVTILLVMPCSKRKYEPYFISVIY